jgi:hypothetical protein
VFLATYGIATTALTIRYKTTAPITGFGSLKFAAAIAMAIAGCREAVESASTLRCSGAGRPSQ